jgi:hypothetical protein
MDKADEAACASITFGPMQRSVQSYWRIEAGGTVREPPIRVWFYKKAVE